MNTLADNALFEAFLCGRSQVSRVDVERAHSDLGWETLASLDTPGPAASTEAAPIADAAATGSDPNEDTGSDFHKTLNQIDSELDSMLTPTNGPPKEDKDEPEDLLVELVELVDE
jgi:hypothetical protein